jgi:hypothetical protein
MSSKRTPQIGDIVMIQPRGRRDTKRRISISYEQYEKFENKLAKITYITTADEEDEGFYNSDEPLYGTDIIDSEVNPEGVYFSGEFLEIYFTI